MYIVIISAEYAPVAKVGGLGDFVQGLARQLADQGHQVEILLPKYDCLVDHHIEGRRQALPDLSVPFFEQWLHCEVERGSVGGIDCWFIDARPPPSFFRRGTIYGEADDPERFAFFCRAALELLLRSGRQPDIIHCSDWQTGLVPVLLFEMYQGLGLTRPRVCFTIHNAGHQGRSGESVLRQVGLDPQRLVTPDRLMDPVHAGTVNLMKGGIVFSNYVTTVSPGYAWEVQNTEQGMGLQETLVQHGAKFAGVLNGIDYESWNPLTDALIARNYGPDSLPDKAFNTGALRERLGLAEERRPLVALVSRLDAQKGVDLMLHGIRYALANGCQVVLLGSAQDPKIDAAFRDLKRETDPRRDCHLELGYDEELAHQIYAGADLIMIPSLYEPCGLTQMIAMRYGVVPVVRGVGGLADTVFDANYSSKPFAERNGYLFDEPAPQALESALERAIGLWFRYPEYFRQLRLNGMRADNSWARPAKRYMEIFERIRT
jgi:starch synthase